MPEMRSASNTELTVTGTITIPPRMDETRKQMKLGVVDKLAVLISLGMTSADKATKSIHPAEGKIIPHHSPQVRILMVHEAKSAAERKTPDVGQFIKQYPTLLLTLTSSEPKFITVA